MRVSLNSSEPLIICGVLVLLVTNGRQWYETAARLGVYPVQGRLLAFATVVAAWLVTSKTAVLLPVFAIPLSVVPIRAVNRWPRRLVPLALAIGLIDLTLRKLAGFYPYSRFLGVQIVWWLIFGWLGAVYVFSDPDSDRVALLIGGYCLIAVQALCLHQIALCLPALNCFCGTFTALILMMTVHGWYRRVRQDASRSAFDGFRRHGR